MANSFWDHVIQSQLERCIFSKYFPTLRIVKSVVETFTPCNQIVIFEESYVCPLCNMDVKFGTDHAQINSATNTHTELGK